MTDPGAPEPRAPKPSTLVITDNTALSRFEIAINGEIAVLQYQRRPAAFVLVHTEVPPPLRGQRIGEALAEAGLEAARASGLTVVVICPFVHAYMKRHGLPSA